MTIIDQCLSFIAPFDCLVCQQEGPLLCAGCRLERLLPPQPLCYRCQQLASPSLLCQSCRPATVLDHVWVATDYQGLAKQLVAALKFNRAQSVARLLALTIAESLPYLPANTLICPLPTANRRVRQRGYDQSQLIARQLAKHRQASPILFVNALHCRGKNWRKPPSNVVPR